jgi:ribonuclease HII
MSDWISATIIEDDELEQNGLGLQQKIKELEQKVKELESSQAKIKKPRKYTKKPKDDTKNDTKDDTKNDTKNDIKDDTKNEPNPNTEPVVNVIPECLLKKFYHSELNIMEIGCDEAGRGPMFGRVYSGAVVLPKDDSFDHFKMKDSKKFTSKNPKKIQEVADYIKEHAVAWAVEYEDERVIDDINILQATQSAMHKAIRSVIRKLNALNLGLDPNNLFLLIDGNYFKPLTIFNKHTNRIENAKYETVEGGDNKYTAIAAASILAKVERDKYIDELCIQNPELSERYGIDSNKGYGSKRHMDGIKQYGITKWHRRSFGICKSFS